MTTGMGVEEEDLVKKRLKKKKKKKKKRSKHNKNDNEEALGTKVKDNGAELDSNVIVEESYGEKGCTRLKSRNRRTLEYREDGKECETDVGFEEVGDKEAGGKKKQIGGEKGMRGLDMGESETELGNGVSGKKKKRKKDKGEMELDNGVSGKKKERKKDRGEKELDNRLSGTKKKRKKDKGHKKTVGMSSFSEENINAKELGEDIETKESGSNEMDEIFDDAVGAEVGVIKERKDKKTRNKEEGMGSSVEGFEEVGGKEVGNTKRVGREKSIKNLEMSEWEKELDNVVKWESTSDKKKKLKKDKGDQKKVGMGLFSEENLNGKKLGEYIETKELGSNEMEQTCDDAVGGEGGVIKEKKKEEKRKEKKVTVLESLKSEISEERKSITSNEQIKNQRHQVEGSNEIKFGYSKDKKKGKKYKNGTEKFEKPADIENTTFEDEKVTYHEGHSNSISQKKRYRVDEEEQLLGKKKTKKAKLVKDSPEKMDDKGETKTNNEEEISDYSRNAETKKPSKRVRFSNEVEVFPSSHATDAGYRDLDGKLVRGKRFSKEEDKIVEDAVLNYIAEHHLGEDGLKMVLHCRKYPEVRNCWATINAAIPWRPRVAVYYRAHILFERDEVRKWTPEDKELIKKFHAKHGPDWRTLADELGKHRIHMKDTWRRLKLPNLKKGQWSQEEYQILFELVNQDLRKKVFEERKSQYGMLRDNIPWEAISNKLSTRTNPDCCNKWYKQLVSPLVREGKWAQSDDYRLINALLTIDVGCEEDVDWDNLLDHRPGDVCRKRWKQMWKHLREHGNKLFSQQVEKLSQRYGPDLVEARDIFDSKIPVS